MEVICSSETMVSFQRTARRYISEYTELLITIKLALQELE
jgi:hypothetical protein